MGELIAKCAGIGVQVFIETHSDHILNGIRISVKKQFLNNENVKLFFVEKAIEESRSIHKIQEPHILPNGRLDFWPDGFFDEWEKALDEII